MNIPTIRIQKEKTKCKCVLCSKVVQPEQAVIPYPSSSYRGHTHYALIHFKCFLKDNIETIGLKDVIELAGGE